MDRRAFLTTLLSALFGLAAKPRQLRPGDRFTLATRNLFNPQADLAGQYRQGGMIRMITTHQRQYNEITSSRMDVLYGWSVDVTVGPSVVMPRAAVGDILTLKGRNLVNRPPADPLAFTPTPLPCEALVFHRDAFTLVWG